MAGWRKCDTCRKVLPAEAFDGDAATCTSCLTVPPPKAKAARTSTVRTVRPASPVPPPEERGPLLGKVGSGDLEVRERRARKTAHDLLAEMHAEEYAQLLTQARRDEGLRG